MLANSASESTGPSSCFLLPTALFCRLPCSINWFLLFTASCSLWTFLPLSSSGLMGNLTRKPFVWVSRQNRQRDPLIVTHTHTYRNECHPLCDTIDRILSGGTTLGQSGPGINGNEGVLCFPQSSTITGVSLSDLLMSWTRHSLEVGGGSYPSSEMQMVYSTAPADWSVQLWVRVDLE